MIAGSLAPNFQGYADAVEVNVPLGRVGCSAIVRELGDEVSEDSINRGYISRCSGCAVCAVISESPCFNL
jgi:hypothetical protein